MPGQRRARFMPRCSFSCHYALPALLPIRLRHALPMLRDAVHDSALCFTLTLIADMLPFSLILRRLPPSLLIYYATAATPLRYACAAALCC